MIRNIVFDMGQVLNRFDPEMFLDRARIFGEDRDLLRREVFQSLEWSRLDRGSLTDDEAIALICARLPQRLHAQAAQFVTAWDRPIVPMEGMAALVRELKAKGYGIYLLSNASRRQHSYWPRIPDSECFDNTGDGSLC